MTYLDFFLTRSSRGKRKGRMFCFPCFIKCNFKTYSKIPALRRCDVGEYDYEDIGIAYDEKDRQNQLSTEMRSILVEEKITERMAWKYCEEHGVLSPHYEDNKRDGCALCPNAKASEREKWFAEYPEAKDLVVALQNISIRERQEMSPLRNHQWFVWQPEYDGYQTTVEDWIKGEKEE